MASLSLLFSLTSSSDMVLWFEGVGMMFSFALATISWCSLLLGNRSSVLFSGTKDVSALGLWWNLLVRPEEVFPDHQRLWQCIFHLCLTMTEDTRSSYCLLQTVIWTVCPKHRILKNLPYSSSRRDFLQRPLHWATISLITSPRTGRSEESLYS